MASAEDYAAWIVKNQDKAGTPEFNIVADAYRESKKYAQYSSKSANDVVNEFNPTNDMGAGSRALAGAGKFINDLGLGIGQRFGAVDQKTVDAARELDAPLMNTTAGKAGNIGFALASTAPTLLIPGANTVAGAGVSGALMGLAQPTAKGESAVKNALLGAGLGMGGQMVGNAVGYGYGAAKAAAEPFYAKGQDAILGRLYNKAAGGGTFAQDAAARLSAARELVPGSAPTMGQAAGNPGLAALERTASQTFPEVAAAYGDRLAQQNAARMSALSDLADPAKRTFFKEARDQAAESLYAKAFQEAPAATPWIKGEFSKLVQRPAFKDALKEAQSIALNEGIKLDPKNTTQIAHYAKMALDDAIAAAEGNAQRALIGTRDKLVSLMESKDFAPSYREARATFAEMSKPINEIDVAAAIQKASVNPLKETIQPYAFSRAMSDQTAKKATKFNGATLENTLSPDALQTLRNIQADLARADFAANAGRAGSDSVQKLAYSNLIDQAGIPGWLRSLSVAQLGGNLLGRGADAVYGRANAEMAKKLAESGLNPQEVARVMLLPQTAPSLLPQRLSTAGGLLGFTAPAYIGK